MAKKSAIEKNEKRKRMAAKYFKIRDDLRRQSVNPHVSEAEREEARLKLNKLPRDTSHTRIVSRCMMTGRPRGVLRKFGLSRMALREMAHYGKIPGVTKSSW